MRLRAIRYSVLFAAIVTASIAVLHRVLDGSTATVAYDGGISKEQFRRLLRGSHRVGSPSARVSVLVWFDPACVQCARFQGALDSLLESHPGDVAIAYRPFIVPGNNDSYFVAIGAECSAEQNKFAEFLRVAYSLHPKAIGRRGLKLVRDGTVGLDTMRFNSCVQRPAIAAAVDTAYLVARQLGVDGTPTSVFNGILIDGGESAAILEKLFERRRDW
jgi:protein-disulfide isomerase